MTGYGGAHFLVTWWRAGLRPGASQQELQGPRELQPLVQEATSLVLRAFAGLATLAGPLWQRPASVDLNR